MTIDREVEGTSIKEIEKMKNTIERYGITTDEIEVWKNKNQHRYNEILNIGFRKEYDAMKMIVNEVRETHQN